MRRERLGWVKNGKKMMGEKGRGWAGRRWMVANEKWGCKLGCRSHRGERKKTGSRPGGLGRKEKKEKGRV